MSGEGGMLGLLLLAHIPSLGREPEWCDGDRRDATPCFLGRVHVVGGTRAYWGGRDALVNLSGVGNHSGVLTRFRPLSASLYAALAPVPCHPRPVLLLRRFLPTNLFHALHDDALPLLSTLHSLHHPTPVLLDSFPAHTDYTAFIDAIAPGHVHSHQLPDVVCFENAWAGLQRNTVWYDYGFYKPQAPIPDPDTVAIRSAISTLANSLSLPPATIAEPYGILLTRKHNRLILNEEEVERGLAACTGLRMERMGLESKSLEELVKAVHGASLLVGVHGSLLALALFLPPSATLLELFPYALPPLHYQPYRTLAGLLGLRYAYWGNPDPLASRGHPERAPGLGGLAHLEPGERRAVLATHRVPPHLCCLDPNFLYHIYQDTRVNVTALCDLL